MISPGSFFVGVSLGMRRGGEMEGREDEMEEGGDERGLEVSMAEVRDVEAVG